MMNQAGWANGKENDAKTNSYGIAKSSLRRFL